MRYCINCNSKFEPKGREKTCSIDCRADRKSAQDRISGMNRSRRNLTNGLHGMKFMGNQTINDAEILLRKNIVSPNIHKMPFSIVDAKMKTTYYFRTEEAMTRFIERNATAEKPESLKRGGRTSNFNQ